MQKHIQCRRYRQPETPEVRVVYAGLVDKMDSNARKDDRAIYLRTTERFYQRGVGAFCLVAPLHEAGVAITMQRPESDF